MDYKDLRDAEPLSSKLSRGILGFLFGTKVGRVILVIGALFFGADAALKGLGKYNPNNVVLVVIGALGLFFLFLLVPALRRLSIPRRGVFRIKLKEDLRPNPPFACALIIDVQIPTDDWELIQDAGVMNHALFTYQPRYPRMDEKTKRDFVIADLANKVSVAFADVVEMQAAKERLLEHLHELKAGVERYKAGPRTEVLEL